MISKLLIITTGGTIDKIYFDDKSDYQIGEPQIGQILHSMNIAIDFEVTALMRKDSLHIGDDERRLIHAAATASDASHIVITHGTDTMVETAHVLSDLENRTIVLTGSLNPARFRDPGRRSGGTGDSRNQIIVGVDESPTRSRNDFRGGSCERAADSRLYHS